MILRRLHTLFVFLVSLLLSGFVAAGSDPEGKNPIYSTSGKLLGTDDTGLQGEAIIMEQDKFHQGMSNEDAMSCNLGVSGLVDNEAYDNYTGSYSSLKDRPDWDGYLTKREADDWWLSKSGKPLFVDVGLIKLPGVSTKTFNSNPTLQRNFVYTISRTGFVYGTITISLVNSDTGEIIYKTYPNGNFDKYDFKKNGRIIRDVLTIVGRPGKAPDGVDYLIYGYGKAYVKIKK